MNWEAIAKLGYETFRERMLGFGVSVGVWENLTLAERVALQAYAQVVCEVYSKAATE